LDKKYITVTGTCYRQGTDFMKQDMKVKLVKESDNEFDSEAIAVTMEGLGKIGYVANSVRTRKGESMSAGRLYDQIGTEATATILYIFPDAAVCVVDE